jgi:hypothetical protein
MGILVQHGMGLVAATFALSGCAALNGTRPHDMTGPAHERAADEAAAKGQPELAASHRDAARRLAEVERDACRGVPTKEIAPALTGLSIGASEDIEHWPVSEGSSVIEGSRILVALEGRSLEAMGRVIGCRAARAAVNGGYTDPFAVPGASVRVSPGDAGWASIEIRADDVMKGEEIARRVRGSSQSR